MNYLLKTTFTILSICSVVKAQEKNTDVLFSGKNVYTYNGNTLSKVEKKGKLIPQFQLEENVHDVLMNENEIWLGTDNGVAIFDLNEKKEIRREFDGNKIVSLSKDAEGKIWVATQFKGVYRQSLQNPQEFENKLNVTTNYSIVSTPDNHVYVGTNLGLYKINIQTGKSIRYAEEAHSGHGLPDNIVERLFADKNSNVWVLMPDNIAFNKGDNFFGEIPTFSYVGNEENSIYKIVGLEDQSYLFITQQGVLLLPSSSLNENGHGDEVFSAHQTPAFELSVETIETPKQFLNEKILYAEIKDGNIYFFTEKGVWKTKEKKMIKNLIKNRKNNSKAIAKA